MIDTLMEASLLAEVKWLRKELDGARFDRERFEKLRLELIVVTRKVIEARKALEQQERKNGNSLP